MSLMASGFNFANCTRLSLACRDARTIACQAMLELKGCTSSSAGRPLTGLSFEILLNLKSRRSIERTCVASCRHVWPEIAYSCCNFIWVELLEKTCSKQMPPVQEWQGRSCLQLRLEAHALQLMSALSWSIQWTLSFLVALARP